MDYKLPPEPVKASEINSEESQHNDQKQNQIFTSGTLLNQVSHIIKSLLSDFPSIHSSVMMFFGMTIVVILSSALLSIIDMMVSRIVNFLLGVRLG